MVYKILQGKLKIKQHKRGKPTTLYRLMVNSEIADSKAGSETNFHNRFYFKKNPQVRYHVVNIWPHCHKTFKYKFCIHTRNTSNQKVASIKYHILIGQF